MYSEANIKIYEYNIITNSFKEIIGTTNGLTFEYNNGLNKMSLNKLNKIKLINNNIYSLNKENIINYMIEKSKLRNNIRKYIGISKETYATIQYIDYNKHHIVLSKLKINGNKVDHMNIFMHNFKDRRDYNKNIMNINIGQKVKVRGIISSYIKNICGKEVYDYCFRDFEFIK